MDLDQNTGLPQERQPKKKKAPRRFRPKHFPRELQKVLDACFEGKLIALAEASGVHQSALCYYLMPGHKARFPLPEAFEQILRAVPADKRQALVVAWITDAAPDLAKRYIPKLHEEPKEDQSKPPETSLPEATEKAFAAIRDFAMFSRDVRQWIEVTAKLMQGK